jgi:[acyl-carrier-protein] S-malonyltransferase
LGGAVAQSLIRANWRGLACKADFQRMQAEIPVPGISMALPDQRALVTEGRPNDPCRRSLPPPG